MLKLTKTGIGLLTKQYRSVLRKCWAINEGLFWATIFPMIITSNISFAQSSVAIGSGADASGAYSVAIGNLAKAVGYASFALAPSAKTEARESVAIGNRSFTSAEADKSVALGYTSVANEGFVISIGHTATDINYENGSAYGSNLFRRIVNVAEGSGAHDAVTVSQLGNIASGTKILNANGESAITFGTESGQTTVGTAISNVANQLYNYYYTKTEADARYAKLNGGNTFTGTQVLRSSNNGSVAISLFSDGNSGEISLFNEQDKNYKIVSLSSRSGSGTLKLEDVMGGNKTILSNSSFILNGSSSATGIDFATNVTAGTTNASHLATTGAVNQLLNYYYTFRVDERVEVIEFAKELRSNKKEMSSLDFMPIKSSSNLRINLIKAEDPLTFSAKTRDDSLVLMEVCHA